jgi:hypothetical protein
MPISREPMRAPWRSSVSPRAMSDPAQFDRGCRPLLDKLGLFDHHHRVGAARNDAAGCDRCRRPRQHLDGRLDAARHDFGVEHEPPHRIGAGAGKIGGAHRKTVDIGTIERRRIDRRDHIGREHTAERCGEWNGLAGKRRTIDRGIEAPPRLLGRDHFEELLLPRGALDRVEDRGVRVFQHFLRAGRFLTHGQGLTATGVPSAKPSLSAGTTIQPSLSASEVNDR